MNIPTWVLYFCILLLLNCILFFVIYVLDLRKKLDNQVKINNELAEENDSLIDINETFIKSEMELLAREQQEEQGSKPPIKQKNTIH